MRRRRLVWAACALALVACNADDPKPPPTPVPSGELRLLTVDDLPAGFRVVTDDGPKMVAEHAPESPPACVALSSGEQFPLRTRVFTRGDEVVAELVRDYGTADRAHRGLRDTVPAAGCPSVTLRPPGAPDQVIDAKKPVPIPQIGDESVAKTGGPDHYVTFRLDHYVVTLSTTGIPGGLDYTVTLARRAADLLTQRAQRAP